MVFKTISLNTTFANVKKFTMLGGRLSRNVVPSNYDLTLHPHLIAGKFDGTVNISVDVKKMLNKIYLHSQFLNLSSVKLFSSDNKEIPVPHCYESKENELAVLDLEKEIEPGQYNIVFTFNGDLTKSIVGFYSSRFKDNKKMAGSKFEPTYARQAFPCFDEPGFKATFDVKLVKPKDYIALSNMNQVSVNPGPEPDTEVVSFGRSVPMSTYLACFVVCDFKSIEDIVDTKSVGHPFTLRSFARADQMDKITFAQDIGKRAIEFYIQYYQVPFPLPKLDMIAIPDYVSGATEHWGLITYRETSFLTDSKMTSTSSKLSVASTISHELAHMWFGNLVTMKWWDDIWLNEGFATYMQNKALNAIEPTWEMLERFLPSTLHQALRTDDRISAHPIVQKVETPDEITAIFDAISYYKGSSILRMLENFVGEKDFQNAISDYLNKFKYGSTVTSDLMAVLDGYFGKSNPQHNLTHVMDTWTRQKGYPLITVQEGDKPNTYLLTQKRFLLNPESADKDEVSPFNYRWYVPVTYKTNLGVKEEILWFQDTQKSVELKLDDNVEWFKLNNDQVGYYRVNYTQQMWKKLTQLLMNDYTQLTNADRSNLLEEAYSLASARIISYEVYLDLSTYLVNEKSYTPWMTAEVNCISPLKMKLLHSEAYPLYLNYVRDLITPLYATFSWEENEDLPVMQKLIRSTIFNLACLTNVEDATKTAKKLFYQWLNDPKNVHLEPDLRAIIYRYGMMDVNETDWDKMWNIYLREEDPQEAELLRSALAAPKDILLLERYLNLAWDVAKVRSQDYISVLRTISFNPSGTALIWDHYRENWPKLVERYSLNSRVLGQVIVIVTKTFDTSTKLHEVEEFFAAYPEAGAGAASRNAALETLKHNIEWNRRNKDTVHGWLQKRYANKEKTMFM